MFHLIKASSHKLKHPPFTLPKLCFFVLCCLLLCFLPYFLLCVLAFMLFFLFPFAPFLLPVVRSSLFICFRFPFLSFLPVFLPVFFLCFSSTTLPFVLSCCNWSLFLLLRLLFMGVEVSWPCSLGKRAADSVRGVCWRSMVLKLVENRQTVHLAQQCRCKDGLTGA